MANISTATEEGLGSVYALIAGILQGPLSGLQVSDGHGKPVAGRPTVDFSVRDVNGRFYESTGIVPVNVIATVKGLQTQVAGSLAARTFDIVRQAGLSAQATGDPLACVVASIVAVDSPGSAKRNGEVIL